MQKSFMIHHKELFDAVLQEAYDDGEYYFLDLRYRFAIAQFSDTLSIKASGFEVTERVFDILWRSLGAVFEAYANDALHRDVSEKQINKTVKQWLTEFQPEKKEGG